MTVPREELILDYTICPDPGDVVMTALNGTPGMEAKLRSTGINLISGAVEWWRKPGIVERCTQRLLSAAACSARRSGRGSGERRCR
ncbi:hypothetical protein [Nocardia sp. NPDC004860]|uniref:hypothetical protein n=1 Tax=Nocardia sp. NPDC004860 TaxID=3154557 RepID=UPI0033A740B2